MKNIIVCTKQVPNTVDFKFIQSEKRIVRQNVELITNPFDENSLEEALKIKEKSEANVIALSIGPEQSENVLKDAIAMGVDDAVHVSDENILQSDSWSTAHILSEAIKKIGDYDIIFCGKQSIDGETGHIGPMLSEMLNVPCITNVSSIEIIDDSVKAKTITDTGYMIISSKFPVILTSLKNLNEPRYPSLKGKVKAKKFPIKKWNLEELGIAPGHVGEKGSPSKVESISTPPPRGVSEMPNGSPEEIGVAIVSKLKSMKVI